MNDFDLDGHDFVELNNLLKLTGLCPSGGSAKMVIAEGQVNVDGQREQRKRCKIRPGQVVDFAGQEIKVIQQAFKKPNS
ncbi:MAG: RNA-binding S4 domain-containing protein [Deltaproteobacteria bacterium]|jgi:ribosome-associated protein|nr:RNA-binding S4 domain-containing protein [Deltaproteobacteria bacterium]MCW8893367.1 RNA-binding S4 domain-containing protein [Deltaproteobacteria bacterium]MCW9050527.1 RNA-binding S4 domain-containing protein [Deltaproteobacteria bacterium]